MKKPAATAAGAASSPGVRMEVEGSGGNKKLSRTSSTPKSPAGGQDGTGDIYQSKRRAKGSKGEERGLLIRSPHIDKFFLPVFERKTHEVRNFFCQVISKGSHIYLIESGLRDEKNRAVFKVRAKAEFRGNTFVPHDDFSKHFRQHRCSSEEYDCVRKQWTADKNGCVLWEIIVLEIFETPTYIVPKAGEERVVNYEVVVGMAPNHKVGKVFACLFMCSCHLFTPITKYMYLMYP